MRISIFNKKNVSNYKNEYKKIIKVLNSKCITIDKKNYSYFDFINKYLFNSWNYRGTYLDVYLYLDSIGVSLDNKKITLDSLLSLIEVLLNFNQLIESSKYYSKNVIYSTKCSSILFHNIPIILEELNYQAYSIDDKVYVYERDISYEELLDMLPDSINELIISYKSINNNGIKMKRIILEKLYYYLEENKDKYRKNNSNIYSTIKTVITKMGVINGIHKSYQGLSNYKLKKYYDYCFELMIYLMNTEVIMKYRDEIRSYS